MPANFHTLKVSLAGQMMEGLAVPWRRVGSAINWIVVGCLWGTSGLLGTPSGQADFQTEWVQNGGFEKEWLGWNPLWTRTPEAGRAVLDGQEFHRGLRAIRIEHHGEQDWSLSSQDRWAVQPGDLFTLEAWVRTQGAGEVTLGVITYDGTGKTLDWVYGGSSVSGQGSWRRLQSRFAIPEGTTHIQPRLLGIRPLTVWVDDVSLRRAGRISDLRAPDLPPRLTLSNAVLTVALDTARAVLWVRDDRTGQEWSQQAAQSDLVLIEGTGGPEMRAVLLHVASAQRIELAMALEGDLPELTCTLSATGALSGTLRFPHPFVTGPGTDLIVPMNEGISYPVEDETITPRRLIAYGGHGICMAFWGVCDGPRGQMAIIETPDDAAIQLEHRGKNLVVAPEWEPEKGQFGYARRLRYVFFDQGGYVAMAKRYRAHVQHLGRLKTLEQKRVQNPNVDLLIGAVNVWCWEVDALSLATEMKKAGIERILWSHRQSPEALSQLNQEGVLTSRYDIYQDVMDPGNFEHLRGVHPDWTTEAWPEDIIRQGNGEWLHGWRVKGRDGQWYPCGVICDRQALSYAARRIPAELRTHPYRCRFIDTTTAAPWQECYHPDHPMTRSESRHFKMELLRYVSEDMNLVTGSETGHDAVVPFVHYFEGMLSLGPYRVADAGRDMQRIWDEVPDQVARFQLGHRYRVPLWELVYHDCVVAQWYWGDYNNKLPALWDKRDLFNILYGTPPMFMFNRSLWAQNRARFEQSYRNVGPVARAAGYAEMIDHRYLTADRSVQQSRFANGLTVTVNFGNQPFQVEAGGVLEPMAFRVEEVEK